MKVFALILAASLLSVSQTVKVEVELLSHALDDEALNLAEKTKRPTALVDKKKNKRAQSIGGKKRATWNPR